MEAYFADNQCQINRVKPEEADELLFAKIDCETSKKQGCQTARRGRFFILTSFFDFFGENRILLAIFIFYWRFFSFIGELEYIIVFFQLPFAQIVECDYSDTTTSNAKKPASAGFCILF